MTDHETELKLQALLDGELSGAESESVRLLISHDPEARALYEELQAIRALLAENELELKVPDSREFYWSGIQRSIEFEEREAQSERPSPTSVPSWLRLFLPVGAVAVVALTLTLGWPLLGGGKRGWPALAGSHEIETPLEDTPSFTFRSESEAMTVVWVDSGPN